MTPPRLPSPKPTKSGVPLRPPVVPRADLYWPAHAWAGGTELVWEDRTVAHAVGSLQRWEADRTPKDLMWQVIEDPVALDLLAVCLGWGTVTVDVAYAIAGHEALIGPGGSQKLEWSRLHRSTRRLFGAGLIERGQSLSPAATVPWAIRIHKGRALTSLLHQLDGDRLAWVTAGRKPEAPTRGDRHNALSSALAQKLAENAEIAAVLGPRASAHHDLDITGRTKPSRRAADLVAVLDSGLRLAIEVTASATPSLRQKIVTWIELLEHTPHEDLGLKVIFLDAGDPVRQTPNQVWAPVTRAIGEELAKRPYAQALGVHRRLLVTRWSQWMPRDGSATLDLKRMLTLGWTPQRWVFVPLRNGLDAFEPDRPELFVPLATEAKQMAECPAVLRAARPSPRSAAA